MHWSDRTAVAVGQGCCWLVFCEGKRYATRRWRWFCPQRLFSGETVNTTKLRGFYLRLLLLACPLLWPNQPASRSSASTFSRDVSALNNNRILAPPRRFDQSEASAFVCTSTNRVGERKLPLVVVAVIQDCVEEVVWGCVGVVGAVDKGWLIYNCKLHMYKFN